MKMKERIAQLEEENRFLKERISNQDGQISSLMEQNRLLLTGAGVSRPGMSRDALATLEAEPSGPPPEMLQKMMNMWIDISGADDLTSEDNDGEE